MLKENMVVGLEVRVGREVIKQYIIDYPRTLTDNVITRANGTMCVTNGNKNDNEGFYTRNNEIEPYVLVGELEC